VSRTVFLGTSEFAAIVLRRLTGSKHRPQLVVTPPDRKRGRGRRMLPPPAAATADELDLALLQAESVNAPEALEQIRDANPDCVVVCAFGQLIKEPLLSEFPMLNLHPSLLPRWRGAAPIERAMIAGDEETGVCVMKLTAGLDSGPVALRESTAIAPDADFGALSARLARLGGELMVRALDLDAKGELRFEEQDDSAATYAEKIEPGERRLDPRRSAEELERVVRALTPHIGAYLQLEGGERLGVRAAGAEAGAGAPGELQAHDGELRLACGEGLLRLEVVQPAGGRSMDAADYVRGHAIPDRIMLDNG
jgi:methionyl-tRNA formyltransferase